MALLIIINSFDKSSDEAISEIVQIYEIRNPESASQTSASPAIQHKSQTKSSCVWNHFIKKLNEKDGLCAYCQYLSSHIIKHGLIPPSSAETIISAKIKSKPTLSHDNTGANVVVAIRELAPIKRLSCAVYTLQLAIRKGLKLVENLATHTKQLINFFSTQKQIERLIKVQKDSGYEEQLYLIQDISTRWNSSYLVWDHLIFLQYAILQLNINLSCSFICKEKANSIKSKKIMLNDTKISNLDEEDINDKTINSDDLEENLTDHQIN
ncbi:zinc finger BED domain-containing protein 1-like [Rhizophagus irregularis DAOM 181602=DAOM 197198]|nr:zinc finger BED domain-containing protein 1-like [Rhizophagus irregularis DAOM 181602=DAOM 197198]